MDQANNRKSRNVAYATGKRPVSKKMDLRVIRTRKLLWESLVHLVEEREFTSITVGDIAANAMVNRATFYRHYEGKTDLLERGTAEIVKELAEKIRPVKPAGTANRQDFDAAKQGLLLILDHVAEHSEFYRIMLGSAAGSTLRGTIQDLIDDFLLRKIEAVNEGVSGPESRHLVPDAVTARTVSSVIVGLISWWIDERTPVAKDQLVEYYLRLMVLGPYRCLGFEPKDDLFPASVS